MEKIFLWKNVDSEKIINYLNTYKRFEEQRSLEHHNLQDILRI